MFDQLTGDPTLNSFKLRIYQIIHLNNSSWIGDGQSLIQYIFLFQQIGIN